MTPSIILSIYCMLLLLASLGGGWLLLSIRLTHTGMQTAVSFVAGLMLGMALLHFIPHAFHQNHSLDVTMRWVLGGFLAMFFLQRLFHDHHHDAPGGMAEDTGLAVPHPEPSQNDASSGHWSWVGAAMGLTLHSVMDGITLAASLAAATQGPIGQIGLGTALALILHKPFDAMALSVIMAKSGCSNFFRQLLNSLFALVSPIAVLLFYFGVSHSGCGNSDVVGSALAFCAGSFLCIAGTDLLPELQFHSHDRFKLSMALLAGLALSWLIGTFEAHNQHGHGSMPPNPTAIDSTQLGHFASIESV